MTLSQERRVVVAEPHLTLSVLPDKRLERQIDADGLRAFHEWRAALRITEDDYLRGPQRLAHLCRAGCVVDTREDIETAFLG